LTDLDREIESREPSVISGFSVLGNGRLFSSEEGASRESLIAKDRDTPARV
jgi:hypothetical protein